MNEQFIKKPINYLKDIIGVYGEGNLEMLVKEGNQLALEFKSRIEGRTRDTDPTEAMRLRVHDPLWMLARQWQMGEFRGNNIGTAMSVRCLVKYDNCSSEPIEPVTEQINPRIDLLARIESAVYLSDLLRNNGMRTKEFLPKLMRDFPIDWDALDDSLVLPDAVTSFSAIGFLSVTSLTILAISVLISVNSAGSLVASSLNCKRTISLFWSSVPNVFTALTWF